MGLGGRTIENGRGASNATCVNKPSATAAKNAAREAKFKLVSAWRPLRFVLRHVAGRGGGSGRGERPPAVFRVGEMGRKRGSAGLGQSDKHGHQCMGKPQTPRTNGGPVCALPHASISPGRPPPGPPRLKPSRSYLQKHPPRRRRSADKGISRGIILDERSEAVLVTFCLFYFLGGFIQ